jgi:hypothetical protein
MRFHLQSPLRHDDNRVLPGETGYESSDLEEDYKTDNAVRRNPVRTLDQELSASTTSSWQAKTAYRQKAKNIVTRMERIEHSLRTRDIVQDVLYFHAGNRMQHDQNYRAFLDYTSANNSTLPDTPSSDTVSRAEFMDYMHLALLARHDASYLDKATTAICEVLPQGPVESVAVYTTTGEKLLGALTFILDANEASPRERTKGVGSFMLAWVQGLRANLQGDLEIRLLQQVSQGETPMTLRAAAAMASAYEAKAKARATPLRAPAHAQTPADTQSSDDRLAAKVTVAVGREMAKGMKALADAIKPAPQNAMMPPWYPPPPPLPPPAGNGLSPPPPRTKVTERNKTNICGNCEREGKDSRHLYYLCPNGYYKGCMRCQQQGHLAKTCTNACTECGKVAPGMIKVQSHELGCSRRQ